METPKNRLIFQCTYILNFTVNVTTKVRIEISSHHSVCERAEFLFRVRGQVKGQVEVMGWKKCGRF